MKETISGTLEKLLPQSRKWLMERGYIVTDGEGGELKWTEEGLKWIIQLMPKPKVNTR